MAVEADEIIAAIAEAVEQERRSKIAESRQSETSQLIDQSKNHNDSKAAHKAAELFNTNRSYINDAATHESGNFGVSVNKLTETKDENAGRVHTKAAELVLTSRKTGWLTSRTFTSFSPPSRQHYM
ncbi:MAG: hypothetical protein GX087_12040 [Desulfobulbaceae bacterium]|nr:hypothetical protein [Desulfobulbaceae bacterium]